MGLEINTLVTDIEQAIDNVSLVCQAPHGSIVSGGLGRYHNPLRSSTSLFLLQLSAIAIVSQLINLCLKPMGQSTIVSQMFGGVIFGPSLLGHRKEIANTIFPIKGANVFETISTFGLMFFLFSIGVKMNAGRMIRPERRVVAIALSMFFFTLALPLCLAMTMREYVAMDETLKTALPTITAAQAVTGSPVIGCLLTELKLMNTDLGRLALSVTMFADVIGISMVGIAMAILGNKTKSALVPVLEIITAAVFILSIIYVFRPTILWMLNRIEEGKSVKESYIITIFLFVLVCGFLSELVSQHYLLGPLVLGFVVPEGPPLGSALVMKLEIMATGLFYPSYLANSGLRTNIFRINPRSTWIMGFLVLFSALVKIGAVMLPAAYFDVPTHEAFVLGIILNAKGITELVMFNIWKQGKILTDQEFALSVFSVIVMTAIVTPLIKFLYDPSNKYTALKRSTIQHLKRESELQILACIDNHDNVPTVINVLEVSNATEENPVAVIGLILTELVGRTNPILVAHQPHDNLDNNTAMSSHIVKALRQYEQHNEGCVSLQAFTSISQYITMHEDVCRVALENRVNLVILPFHKQWAVDGSIGAVNRALRSMNKNVLEMAPCSVGILIDRGLLAGTVSVLTSQYIFHVAVIFIGGADDAEALAYGARMARHRSVDLTVARLLLFGDENSKERKRDTDLVDEYRLANADNERFVVVEELVRDGARLSAVIKSMVDCFDLILVGMHHQDSPLLSGLGEWSECPELGIIGDMLASSDFHCSVSVLVLQQQRIGGKPVSRNQPVDREPLIQDAPPEETVRGSWTITVNE
ncbi:cation/H(+) antiporter 15-like [Pyrus x bretschneideri]|uniref:cation/H(+) antiporter 15-like n=1 Tax=Pyrus x bretschneideri TaxID=225117 RepID=UPI0020304BBD|nr:cation/H(+) antiporter 15-like [Pyrus x bretschneideri]